MLLTVLMTIYAKVSVEEFLRSIGSVLDQTLPPDEVVVVEDGPLPDALRRTVDLVAHEHSLVRLIRLPVNGGSGVASAAGLLAARGDLVARMDADDVSLPHRFERQVALIQRDALDICGSSVQEFHGSPDHVVGLRRLPASQAAIERYSRINSPFNNPSVVLRRDLALQVGGYHDMRYMQDYDLFARMLAAGARVANIDEPLVLFSADTQMLARRSGWEMVRREWNLQRRLRRYGTIGRLGLARNLVLRSVFRLLPAPLLAQSYRRLFHRATEGHDATAPRVSS
jgi:glycosyltransferase involved in cell wall biosynthesis